jgi:hypothetical protein
MKTWTIGDKTRKNVDLHLDNETVSGLHACLTRTDDGRWIIEDKNSMNGTRRLVDGKWVPITRAYVLPDERLRFGRAETTVRKLLTSPRRSSEQGPEHTVPWTQDLTNAFSEMRSFAELKKNVLFVPDLISSPAKHVLRCAYRRQPVNPFAFMLLSGLIYTTITTSGLSGSLLLKTMTDPAKQGELLANFQKGLPACVILLVLALVGNMIPYWVFRRFSPRPRSFDDFMRFMAVLSGMNWMLGTLPALALNEHLQNRDLVIAVYFLSMAMLIYQQTFNVIAHKHFWRISYARTIACYLLSVLVLLVAVVIISLPLALSR